MNAIFSRDLEFWGKNLSKLDEVVSLDNLAKWDELTPVSRKGYLAGKTLRRSEIKFWINEITKISKGNSKLIILPKGHPKLQGNIAGFNPFDGNIYVQKGLTEYEVFHEFKHLEEYMVLGKEEYLKGSKRLGGSPEEQLIRTYKREKYVYDEIIKVKHKWNLSQLEDAEEYIKKIIINCEIEGINIAKIK